jgi:hypothetical protein
MITPDMSFLKSIQLSVSDLDEAKLFGEGVSVKIKDAMNQSFPDGDVDCESSVTADGTYLYSMGNASLKGRTKLVVGWDMKNINGENIRFMAINYSGKAGHQSFLASKETIEKLPNYGYFGGMLLGALVTFAACMVYAYYTEALDVFFFAILILLGGWLSSKVGEKVGEFVFDKRFDTATASAMGDQLYLKSAAQSLAFNQAVTSILDGALEEDRLAIEN